MKLNLTKDQWNELVKQAAFDCGKSILCGHGSLDEHEFNSSKYVFIRGKDNNYHIVDFMNAKEYIDWNEHSYTIHLRIYYNPKCEFVINEFKLYELSDNKEKKPIESFYFRSSLYGYVNDIVTFIKQLNVYVMKLENVEV